VPQIGNPVVSYRETCTEESSIMCLSKSAKCNPASVDLDNKDGKINDNEDGKINPRDEFKARALKAAAAAALLLLLL
jgi:hypothetical protein